MVRAGEGEMVTAEVKADSEKREGGKEGALRRGLT